MAHRRKMHQWWTKQKQTASTSWHPTNDKRQEGHQAKVYIIHPDLTLFSFGSLLDKNSVLTRQKSSMSLVLLRPFLNSHSLLTWQNLIIWGDEEWGHRGAGLVLWLFSKLNWIRKTSSKCWRWYKRQQEYGQPFCMAANLFISLRCNMQLHQQSRDEKEVPDCLSPLFKHTGKSHSSSSCGEKKRVLFHIFSPSGNYKESLVYTRPYDWIVKVTVKLNITFTTLLVSYYIK